jgi:hypothetical protein
LDFFIRQYGSIQSTDFSGIAAKFEKSFHCNNTLPVQFEECLVHGDITILPVGPEMTTRPLSNIANFFSISGNCSSSIVLTTAGSRRMDRLNFPRSWPHYSAG